MRKNLFTAFALLIISSGIAQSTFTFTKTCYRGAFAPAPTPMWTDTWTEWDPQNKAYPAPNMTVTTDITSSTTWSAGSVILLSKVCYVKGNSVLTIQPGVVIRGDINIAGAALVITKGSQLIANGTVNQPIVFTSDQPAGQRSKGNWGGVILLGKADNNNASKVNNIEGLPISSDTEYGGGPSFDNNDNSGSLKYVRIEFGGYVYQPNQEINGLTFGAVGRGTVIDNVQVSFANDDAYEWFGGTVNCSHLVAYRCLDDDFDTDNGYSGHVQFGLGVRDPGIADDPSVSTSEGFESDNDPGGTSNTPKTAAIFSNITDIGPLRGVVTATLPAGGNGFRRGARIRRNSELKIYNSILIDHKTRGLMIDGAACETNANSGALKFMNNIVAGYGQKATEVSSPTIAILTNPNAWIISNGNDTLKSSANILTNPYSVTNPTLFTGSEDYRPAPGSVALSGANFTDAPIAAVTGTVAAQVMANSPSQFCIGTSTSITMPAVFAPSTTITPGYCSLSWSVTPGVQMSSSTAVNPTFTISTVGTFSVYLTVVTANGNISAVNAITTSTCENVGVEKINNASGMVTLYPNPATNYVEISVDIDKTSPISINIFDITGKLVLSPVTGYEAETGKNTFVISTDALENGIYLVNVGSSQCKGTVKLIINK